jgi:hypothetical protein
MKPKYSASITRLIPSCIDLDFSRPLALETRKKLKDLGHYEGVRVYNQPTGEGIYFLLEPVWDSNTVVEEIVSILISEGFDKDSILVK